MTTLLDQDKLWAEEQTSLLWARTEQTKFIPLNQPNPRDVANEVAELARLRKNRFNTPSEL